MHKSKFIIYIILLTIVILGFFLRIYKLADIPPGLNRDEASIGYTVYSLLQSGTDEYGVKWPISFKSFGDWKVPVYFYLDLPFVKILNLTEFSVRLPSVVFGSLTVLLVFFLIKQILQSETRNTENLLDKIPVNVAALVSSLMLAISPWHIFMSRNASEANIAVFFVTLALVLFYASFKRKYLIIISFFILSISLFTYHAYHIFTPLLFIIICLVYYKQLLKNNYFKYAVITFILMSVIIYSQTLFGADKTKISGLFPLADIAKVYENVVLRRLEYSDQNILVKILHNRPVYLFKTVIINYLKSLSPEFLFISGGTNLQHNIPDFGNLYLWEVIIWPIIFYGLSKSKKRYGIFLILWLLISPIAGSITKDAPHTNRMMVLLPLPAILSGLGIVYLIYSFNNIWRKVTITIIAIVVCINFITYNDQYYFHFPYVSAKDWGFGYRAMVEKINQYQNLYPKIIIARPDFSPYIYYLFYNKINPLEYQNNVVRYPETSEGFVHVAQFHNLYFQKINWTTELLQPNRLYIDWVNGLPDVATNSARLITPKLMESLIHEGVVIPDIKIGMQINSRIIDQVVLPDKSAWLYFIETYIATPPAKNL